jgi:hypothetical protein
MRQSAGSPHQLADFGASPAPRTVRPGDFLLVPICWKVTTHSI